MESNLLWDTSVLVSCWIRSRKDCQTLLLKDGSNATTMGTQMSLVLCLRVMHPLNTNTWFSGCVITKSQFLLVLFISQASSQFWEIQSQLLHLWIPEHVSGMHFWREQHTTILQGITVGPYSCIRESSFMWWGWHQPQCSIGDGTSVMKHQICERKWVLFSTQLVRAGQARQSPAPWLGASQQAEP